MDELSDEERRRNEELMRKLESGFVEEGDLLQDMLDKRRTPGHPPIPQPLFSSTRDLSPEDIRREKRAAKRRRKMGLP